MNWMQDVMDAKKRGAMFPGDREECEMTDQIKQWLQDRRDTHARTTESAARVLWGYGEMGITVEDADANAITDAMNNLPTLLGALGEVLELHWEQAGAGWHDGYCICGESFPCPTVRAVQSAIEGASDEH